MPAPQVIKGLFVIQWLNFPKGNRAYGGGGWSKSARHRPLPEPFQQVVKEYSTTGKSVIVDGVRKLKLNIFDAKDKKWVRCDYPDLKQGFEFHSHFWNDVKEAISKGQATKPLPVGGERKMKIN